MDYKTKLLETIAKQNAMIILMNICSHELMTIEIKFAFVSYLKNFGKTGSQN